MVGAATSSSSSRSVPRSSEPMNAQHRDVVLPSWTSTIASEEPDQAGRACCANAQRPSVRISAAAWPGNGPSRVRAREQTGSQFLIADVDGQHRICRLASVSSADSNGGIDGAPIPARAASGRRTVAELVAVEAVTRGKLRMCPLELAVGGLQGAKQLLLHQLGNCDRPAARKPRRASRARRRAGRRW